MNLFVGLLLGIVSATASPDVRLARGAGGSLEVSNGFVHLRLSAEAGSYQEILRAGDATGVAVFRSGSSIRPDPALKSDGTALAVGFTAVQVGEEGPERAVVILTGEGGGHFIRKTLTLERGSPALQVVVRDSVPGVAELSYLLSSYTFLPTTGRPEFVWTPALRPDEDDVIADHSFRTPVLILQQGPTMGALIPDVARIQPWRSVQTAADLQVHVQGGAMVSFGAINWCRRSHLFFTHSDKMTTQIVDGRFEYGYKLYVSAHETPQHGYQTVLHWLWAELGRVNLVNGPSPQTEPFASYIRKAWYEYLPSIATDTTYEGSPVTLLSQARLSWSNKLPPSANRDTWFTVWFNALRTSVGVYLDALDSSDAGLQERAVGVLNLALSAPEHEGLTPSIFYLDSSGGHWVADQGWGGIAGGAYYSMFNNCWTGTWLLKWAELLPGRREEILRRTRRLGDFLLAHQLPSGVIPSWYHPGTLEPADTFRTENAETAGAALFLAKLARQTGENAYLLGARRAMDYLETAIIPAHKWYDFETFFSCSRKSLTFVDSISGQHPQNTLSIHQAAEAALALYQATGEDSYRTLGIALIDYLCLYQQLWSPKWLSRRLFGGFGVQNTDGEWSDSRQGYFAVTLGDYFDLTGKREYLERAVAALRAMFSLFEAPDSPRTAENYSHTAINRLEGVTGINWGTGSSTVSIHLLCARFGDLFVHAADGWGVGINGCTVTRVRLEGNRLMVDVEDFVGHERNATLKCTGLDRDAYGVVINAREPLTFTRSQLEAGVSVIL